jgi:hypothetical protein
MAVNFTRESAGRVKLARLLTCTISIKQLCSIPLLPNVTSSPNVLKERVTSRYSCQKKTSNIAGSEYANCTGDSITLQLQSSGFLAIAADPLRYLSFQHCTSDPLCLPDIAR